MKKIFFLLVISILLVSCTGSSYEPTQTSLPSLDVSITSTLVATTSAPTITPSTTSVHLTSIPIVTATITLTRTARPTAKPALIPTSTPTFGIGSVKTHTPVPQAQCPTENTELIPEFEFSSYSAASLELFYQHILDFLNSGGTFSAVITAYHQYEPEVDERTIQERDVTADGIPELLLTDRNSFVAFVCQNGQYQRKALVAGTYHYNRPVIVDIQDMNLDGVPEIISIAGDYRIREVSVVSWNGNEFQWLNVGQPCYFLLGDSWAYALDIDNNGLLELVLKQAIPVWSEYYDGLPWRPETRVCSWNGVQFVISHMTIDSPPEYRFQAVQDGDRAALVGDYTKALDLYQQAIFSDQLDWWSQERSVYERSTMLPENGLRPTPDSSVHADPAEYPSLAAYARYRIMLLHTVQGYLPEAQIVYDTLQAKFPDGQTGHVYAEMASAFWNEYQVSGNISQACAKAIAYASLNPVEVLVYLGNSDYSIVNFGDQSLEYTPKDICPYR